MEREYDDELDNEFVDFKDYGDEALPISIHDNNSCDIGESGESICIPRLSVSPGIGKSYHSNALNVITLCMSF